MARWANFPPYAVLAQSKGLSELLRQFPIEMAKYIFSGKAWLHTYRHATSALPLACDLENIEGGKTKKTKKT